MRVGGGGVSRIWGAEQGDWDKKAEPEKGKTRNGGDQRRLAWNTAAVKGGEG